MPETTNQTTMVDNDLAVEVQPAAPVQTCRQCHRQSATSPGLTWRGGGGYCDICHGFQRLSDLTGAIINSGEATIYLRRNGTRAYCSQAERMSDRCCAYAGNYWEAAAFSPADGVVVDDRGHESPMASVPEGLRRSYTRITYPSREPLRYSGHAHSCVRGVGDLAGQVEYAICADTRNLLACDSCGRYVIGERSAFDGNHLCPDCHRSHVRQAGSFSRERSPAGVVRSQRGSALIPADMTIGAELETVVGHHASAVAFRAALCDWGWTHDGSIVVDSESIGDDGRRRNVRFAPEHGVEFLTPIMEGPAAVEQLVKFGQYWAAAPKYDSDDMPRGRCWVNRSCGYHVHIGARGWSAGDVARVWAAWQANQDAIYAIQPGSRASGEYSRKLRPRELADLRAIEDDCDDQADNWLASLWYAGDLQDDYSREDNDHCTKYDRTRYHGLNLHSYFYRRTIEVRLGAATTNGHKAVMWASLMARFLHRARQANSVGRAFSIKLLSTATPAVKRWAVDRAKRLNGVTLA